jgi:Ca2+:H+ antiporter
MTVFSGLTAGERTLMVLAAGLTAGAAVCQVADAPGVLRFVICAGALASVAWLVGFSTEIIGTRFGPGVTGVMQSTLGNAPELFVVLFALAAGQTIVAETAIFGSIFSNALLILGITIIVGAHAAPDGVMRFGHRLPNDTATLLLMAVFIITMVGLSGYANDRASHHLVAISVVGAICLLVVYGAWLHAYLRHDIRTNATAVQDRPHPEAASVSFRAAIILLGAAGIAAAFVSDWFVGAIDPAVSGLSLPKPFVGLVIVAIASNAVENVVGIQLAAKQKNELAMSIIKNSIAQIAVFLYPVLVLISLMFATHLTFAVSGILIGGLALTAISVWQITGDGEATAFEGWALVGLYVILAALFFFE